MSSSYCHCHRNSVLEASRDTKTGQEASRATPIPRPTAEQGAQSAMVEQGAWAAMADPGTRTAIAEQGAWVAMAGRSPTTPPTKILGGSRGLIGKFAEAGTWWCSGSVDSQGARGEWALVGTRGERALGGSLAARTLGGTLAERTLHSAFEGLELYACVCVCVCVCLCCLPSNPKVS